MVLSRIVRRWIAGETIKELLKEARKTNEKGMKALLNKLGEHYKTKEKVRETIRDYLKIIEEIKKNKLNASLSLKLTQLGIDIDYEYCFINTKRIVEEAGKNKVMVWIDMESSSYTDETIKIHNKLHRRHRNVGIVIQASLKRSHNDILGLASRKARIRLVKGAYKEKKNIAFDSKEKVNRNFIKLMELLFEKGHYFAIATHDRKMIEAAIKMNNKYDRRFKFQLLRGVKNKLKENLVSQGYLVGEYIPYGKEWMAYTIRRLMEKRGNINLILRTIKSS